MKAAGDNSVSIGFAGLSVGVGLAGVLIGGVLTWVAIGNPERSEPATPESGLAELTMEVRDLGGLVRNLSEAQIEPPSKPRLPVVRESERASISPEILARLDRLEVALTKLLESNAAIADSQVRSYGDPPPLEGIHLPIDVAALKGLGLNEEIDNDLQHLNWSFQKVLDVYGKPSRSNPSPGGGGHKWYYELPKGGEVVFWFIDGLVVRAMTMDS